MYGDVVKYKKKTANQRKIYAFFQRNKKILMFVSGANKSRKENFNQI